MDTIVQLFERHFSPEKLKEHRLAWLNITNTIAVSLCKELFAASMSFSDKENKEFKNIDVSTQALDESYLTHEEKSIPCGSAVEGAHLARMFFEDCQREVEFDIMCQVSKINREKCLEQCDKSNPMFVHIVFEMLPDVIDECVSRCGDDFQKLFIYNYNNNPKPCLSSEFLKSRAKCYLNQSPDFLKRMGGHKQHVHFPEWKSNDVPGTFKIVFSNDYEYAGEHESNPEDFEKRVINEVLNGSSEFELLANEMVQKLKQMQDNFLSSRLEGKLKVVQITLAIEWSKQCLLLTNFLCDHRQETIGYALRQLIGLDAKEMTENVRTPLKKKFANYLSIFNTLFHEPDSVKAEQTLLDFETEIKSLRCLIGLDALLQQELLYMKTVHFAQKETEDFKHSPENWSILLENVSRLSIDLVFCLKCHFWPKVAEEWSERKREWPEQDTIKEVVSNGIHVVCKELHHSAIDWRLSFSAAEVEITQQWTLWQHYIYFIFKSLFYKYLKPLNKDNKVVTSYLIKTVMLNVSENFAQSWWCKENAGECLNVLLATLISAFESKLLSHHFIRTFNLLEGASYDKKLEPILNAAIEKLNSLLSKPEEVVSSLSATLKKVEEFITNVTQAAMNNPIETKLLPQISLFANSLNNYDFNKWK